MKRDDDHRGRSEPARIARRKQAIGRRLVTAGWQLLLVALTILAVAYLVS